MLYVIFFVIRHPIAFVLSQYPVNITIHISGSSQVTKIIFCAVKKIAIEFLKLRRSRWFVWYIDHQGWELGRLSVDSHQPCLLLLSKLTTGSSQSSLWLSNPYDQSYVNKPLIWSVIILGGGFWQCNPVNTAFSTVIDRVTLSIVHLELLLIGSPCQ